MKKNIYHFTICIFLLIFSLPVFAQSASISSEEIDPYLTGVVRVFCFPKSLVTSSSTMETLNGTGSLWNTSNFGYSVLTNYHVINIANSDCSFALSDNGNIKADSTSRKVSSGKVSGSEWWYLDNDNVFKWNKVSDEVLLKVIKDSVGGDSPKGLNYKIGDLPLCDNSIVVNSPVAIIGFKGGFTTSDQIHTGRVVTNGVISMYDDSPRKDFGLPYQNYYANTQAGEGNSGGIAFSKNSKGLCVLGIPTQVLTRLGGLKYTLIQNIHNVFYRFPTNASFSATSSGEINNDNVYISKNNVSINNNSSSTTFSGKKNSDGYSYKAPTYSYKDTYTPQGNDYLNLNGTSSPSSTSSVSVSVNKNNNKYQLIKTLEDFFQQFQLKIQAFLNFK